MVNLSKTNKGFCLEHEVDFSGERTLNVLEKYVDLKNKVIADIGSGAGTLSIELSKKAKHVYGIEPELVLLNESIKNNNTHNITYIKGNNESIPLNTNSVDLIISQNVLEHVDNVNKSFSEFKRILKKDGIIYIDVPNYMWIKEGHYQIYMIPLMPKFLFRIYLRLLKKDVDFINHINYITPRLLNKYAKAYDLELENHSLEWIKDILINEQYNKIPEAYKKLIPLFKIFNKLNINKFIYNIIKSVGFYPHIILTLKHGL